ncbi:hypothetical protein BDF19DRAFT_492786 [Syncephalis fuscata]|nr:hypothetical protein BDF19DRAFT_492786 [Syncephalis fuscata]
MFQQPWLILALVLLSGHSIGSVFGQLPDVGTKCGTPELFFGCIDKTNYRICSKNNVVIKQTCSQGLVCAKNTHIGDPNHCRSSNDDGHRNNPLQTRNEVSTKESVAKANTQMKSDTESGTQPNQPNQPNTSQGLFTNNNNNVNKEQKQNTPATVPPTNNPPTNPSQVKQLQSPNETIYKYCSSNNNGNGNKTPPSPVTQAKVY